MKLYLSIILLIVCCGVNAQRKDTATIQCFCNNQTVYVRFGYNIGDDTTKTFTFNKADAKAWMKDWNTIYAGGTDGRNIDTFYTKTFHYTPATAIGYIAHGSTLIRFTNPFRFPYSVMENDDPETQFYLSRLCTKILNAQIHKP